MRDALLLALTAAAGRRARRHGARRTCSPRTRPQPGPAGPGGRPPAGGGAERSAAALAGFAPAWRTSSAPEPLIVLPATGTGIQSAAVRRLAVPGVATTFATGTVPFLMAGLAALRPAAGAARQAAVLAALLGGAIAGAGAGAHAP